MKDLTFCILSTCEFIASNPGVDVIPTIDCAAIAPPNLTLFLIMDATGAKNPLPLLNEPPNDPNEPPTTILDLSPFPRFTPEPVYLLTPFCNPIVDKPPTAFPAIAPNAGLPVTKVVPTAVPRPANAPVALANGGAICFITFLVAGSFTNCAVLFPTSTAVFSLGF